MSSYDPLEETHSVARPRYVERHDDTTHYALHITQQVPSRRAHTYDERPLTVHMIPSDLQSGDPTAWVVPASERTSLRKELGLGLTKTLT